MQLLDQETCERLAALGGRPGTFFHGTRFMSAILADNELGAPIDGSYTAFITADPQIAAHWANVPRDFDEGRGGIIALDVVKLCTVGPVTNVEPGDRYTYSIEAPLENLSEFIIDTFWLDELVPGLGLRPSPQPDELPYLPAISLASVLRDLRKIRPPSVQELPGEEYNDFYEEVVGRLDLWAWADSRWVPNTYDGAKLVAEID